MCACVGDVVTSRLSNGRAGITKVLQMDISAVMLQRDQATAQVLALPPSFLHQRMCWLTTAPSSFCGQTRLRLLAGLLLFLSSLTHLHMR